MTQDCALLAPARDASTDGRPAGIFITHVLNDRIKSHFDRLNRETHEIIDWQFVYNPWSLTDLVAGRGGFQIDEQSVRVKQALEAGSLTVGHIDIVLFALVRSIGRKFTWVMEYDVDFSGRWLDLFEQFSGNGVDLLATTLNTRLRDRHWYHWRGAVGPCSKFRYLRAFLPLMRVSMRMVDVYEQALATGKWNGHFEFLIPTIARTHGLSIEDIGGTGPFVPRNRRGRNYENTALSSSLSPGTFVWRPALKSYFHENETAFTRPAMLYHPVKSELPE